MDAKNERSSSEATLNNGVLPKFEYIGKTKSGNDIAIIDGVLKVSTVNHGACFLFNQNYYFQVENIYLKYLLTKPENPMTIQDFIGNMLENSGGKNYWRNLKNV